MLRINTPDEVPDDLHGVIGVTAGASAPDELVQGVLGRLAPASGTHLVNVVDEDEYFPPPPELRKIVDAIATLAAATLGAPIAQPSPLAEDRSTGAAVVLQTLVAR